MISALRRFTATTQTFSGCDNTDAGGVLGVRIGGVDTPGDTLTSATDYCGLVTAVCGGTYTYQMLLDGAPVGSEYTVTHPSAIENQTILCIGDTNTEIASALQAIVDRETASFVLASELYYLDTPGIYGGTADTTDGNAYNLTASYPASKAAYQADIQAQYRYALVTDSAKSGRLAIMNKWPMFDATSNHQLYKVDTGSAGMQPGTCLFDAAHAAMHNYLSMGMPIATGTVDTVPVPVSYYNFSNDDVDVITLDGISYSNPFAIGHLGQGTHASNNCTAGEDAQSPWFQERITNSTAKLVVIFNSTMPHGGTSDWGLTLNAWLTANRPDLSVVMVSPDTHQSYGNFWAGSGDYYEVGCSPTAGVTSAKNYSNVSTHYPSDMYDKKSTCTLTATGTTLTVADTTPFRAARRVSQELGGLVTVITSIDSPTTMMMATSRTWTSGQSIVSIDWSDEADIINKTDGIHLANYAKIVRYKNGNKRDSRPHTEVQIIGTYTTLIKQHIIILDGQRQSREYKLSPGVSSGL